MKTAKDRFADKAHILEAKTAYRAVPFALEERTIFDICVRKCDSFELALRDEWGKGPFVTRKLEAK